MGTVHYLGNAKTLEHYQTRAERVQEKGKALGYYIQRYMDAAKELHDANRELREFCSSYMFFKQLFYSDKIERLEKNVELAERKYDRWLGRVADAKAELYKAQFG